LSEHGSGAPDTEWASVPTVPGVPNDDYRRLAAGFMIAVCDTSACSLGPKVHADVSQTAILPERHHYDLV